MGKIRVTKTSSAQRQIDAAVRMLFGGEDALAVHTVTAAAHRVLADLLRHRGSHEHEEIYANALKDVASQLSGRTPSDDAIRRSLPHLIEMLHKHRNRPANFLKHADKDPTTALDPDEMRTDDLLLEACVMYRRLKLPATPEISAFGRWHLAVYPHQEDDRLVTAVGDVSTLSRGDQLEFGSFLLSIVKQDQEPSDKDH